MGKTCTIHVEDEVHCRIAGLRDEQLEVLWNKFGVFAEGYFHMPAYQLRKWDGKIRFFDKKSGETFTKLLDEILPYLSSWGYEINLMDKRLPSPHITDQVTEEFFGLTDFLLRPYQVNVINTLLHQGSGFAICATGAGKTSMCAALSLVLFLNGLQTLIIVPSSDLVTQTVIEFREKLQYYPISIGEYSGSLKDIDHPIVVGTWQSLQNVPHYMSYFQSVIVDEAHGAKANVIKDLLDNHGKHISHRYGVTGTYPKSIPDQVTLKCSVGKIHCEVGARWLIDNGYLSEVEIEPIETADSADLPDYAAERAFLGSCDERIDIIAQLIQDKRDLYGNTFVLVNSIPQGRVLANLIPGSIFLSGESKKGLRQDNYSNFADQDGLIIIASAGIGSTGLSIDRIFCLFLVDAGKSYIKAIQSVGRGLRKKGDKNKVQVIEVYSKLKFAKKHFKDRKKYYSEAGYPVLATKKLKY